MFYFRKKQKQCPVHLVYLDNRSLLGDLRLWSICWLCPLLYQQCVGEDEWQGGKEQEISTWGRKTDGQTPTCASTRHAVGAWAAADRDWGRPGSGGGGGDCRTGGATGSGLSGVSAVGCHFDPSKNAAQYRQQQ